MTSRVVLHVGTPKSGTTYLQRVLRANKAALAEQGVLVAGTSHGEIVRAGLVLREDKRVKDLPPGAAESWDRVVAQVHDFPGETAIISYELLSAARPAQIERALARFEGLDVQVVVTARDYGRLATSAWQERLKFGLTTPLAEWEPPGHQGAEWGWRTLDASLVARRWGAGLPATSVHVVTVPGTGAAADLLWRRFAEAAGIGDTDVDIDQPRANESLGPAAAELLRRVNGTDLGPIQGSREQSRWLRDVLANDILTTLDAESLGSPEPNREDAEQRATAAAERIRKAGWTVHGDLDDLLPGDGAGRRPDEVTDEEVLDVAVRTIGELLQRLRTGSDGEDPAPTEPATTLVDRLPIPFRRGRDVATLEGEVARLERELQAQRRLQERVAMLTDLVSELLLPMGEEQQDVLVRALRRYRKDSM